MGHVYDISAPIYEGMTVYKNNPLKQPKFEVTADFGLATYHETRVHMDAHTGTHVDAPLHMRPGGQTIESIQLDRLVRPCIVIDLTAVEVEIGTDDLRQHRIQKDDFVLLKTRNSLEDAFNPEFVFLGADGARYLAQVGVAGVGIDALGIERSQPEHATHKALFAVDAVIIEGLRLADVEPGRYQMVAAPLRLIGIDAAPARVLLLAQ